jgi:hypothetical protein
MAWRTITEADLGRQISDAELTAFRAAVVGIGDDDPVAGTITECVDEARGYIAKQFTLEAGETIPSKAIRAVVALIIMQIMSRAGGVIVDPDGVRRDNAREGRMLLQAIARGEFEIEEAITGSTETIGTPKPSIKVRTSVWKGDNQSSI